MEPNAQNRRYGTNIVSQPSILCVFAACLRPRPDSVPSATPRWPAFKLSKTDGSGLSLSCSSCLHVCASSARRSTDGSEDPTRQNLFALELESHALSAASFVNSALWLENPDSLGMIFRQILISRLICKRAIAVQNMGVSQRRLGALGHSRVPTGTFFLKPGHKPKSSGARLGVKATGGGCTPRGSRPDSPPPHIWARLALCRLSITKHIGPKNRCWLPRPHTEP